MNVGLVGAHRGKSLLKCLSHFDGVRITAVCDHDAGRAEAVAKGVANGPAKVLTDYARMLEEPIDTVVIATPPSCHVSMSVAALQRGKHVISEVPALDRMSEAGELFDAARQSPGTYAMAENTNFWPALAQVRKLAADGKLGEMYHLEAEYLHECRELWTDANGQPTWRRNYHAIKYCSHSLGPLLEISGRRIVRAVCLHSGSPNRHFKGSLAPDSYSAIFQLDNGGTAVIRTDFSTPQPGRFAGHRFLFHGTKGSVEIPFGHGVTGRCFFHAEDPNSHWTDLAALPAAYQPQDPTEQPPDWATEGGHGTAEYFMLKDFLEAIRGRRRPRIDVRMALAISVPGICAYESARQGGQPVVVPSFW